jgi:signal transduction histidine kinase
LAAPRVEPVEHAHRILALQRNIVLPSKLVVIAVVFYHLYFSRWTDDMEISRVVLDTMQNLFGPYVLLNLAIAASFFVVRQFPPGAVQWLVFMAGLLDGMFLGGLTVLTGGFDSILYWVFPGLILLNAICIPLATPQIVLNLALSACFLAAGFLDLTIREYGTTTVVAPRFGKARKAAPTAYSPDDIKNVPAFVNRLKRRPDPLHQYAWNKFYETTRQKLLTYAGTEAENKELRALLTEEMNRILAPKVVVAAAKPEMPENPAEPFLLRLVVLWLFTFCCYGVQVLAARQQLAEEEQKEFFARTAQLQAAGRLAAEVAHQIKNPLAIINNAAFSLQRALKEGRNEAGAQIEIIQEEVGRVDQIITQIMGYAQLSEGRVEKLSLIEELERAIEQVFPPAVDSGIRVARDYDSHFPPLLMQRPHLAEIFVNLLQNAHEAVGGKGAVTVTARHRPNHAIEVSVQDSGPGIAADRLGRVFEAYFTTKEKGTGLGLAIVKHNVELYGGSVRVESELGKGARFILIFPPRAPMRLSHEN